MVTKEEFGQFISEFESFRDLILEELSKLKNDLESIKYNVDEIARQSKVEINRRIG